jgi:transcription initiation factor TFIIB
VEHGTLAGKSPISLVASCMYLVSCLSNDPRPAKSIAEVAGCTEATLKNAYRLIYQHVELLAKDLEMPKGIDSLPVA